MVHSCFVKETADVEQQLPKRVVQVAAVKALFNDIIDRHAEAYLLAYPEIGEFSNYEKTGTINYYIGMVWTNDFERPDPTQLRIRGSQSIANNGTLELDLSQIRTQQTFFPGQVVAFKADPHLKTQLTVREFLDPMQIAPHMKKLDTEDQVKLLIANGPYLKQAEQSQDVWSLFDRLVETIKEQQATHVILIGPFVEIENVYIKEHYENNWQKIFEKLYENLYDQTCNIYLVPSARDILPHHMRSNYFYPRARINYDPHLKEETQLKCTITTVTDPAQIDLGGIYVDVTSAEVLFHLNQCSTFINKGPGDRFVPFFRHILSQGIYPIYPPAHDMAIDYPKLEPHLQLDRLGPHILILPTKFQTKLEELDERLVCAIHKCTVKKHVLMIEIPKIIHSQDSVASNIDPTPLISLYKHKIIDLFPKVDSVEQQQSVAAAGDSQMALKSGDASGPEEPIAITGAVVDDAERKEEEVVGGN